MNDSAVHSRGLSKRFGRQLAVADLDLTVPRGSVYGFLGPNGSGKTTTIRIILGLAAASAGTVHVLGQEIPGALRQVLPRVGALIEGPAAYPSQGTREVRHLVRSLAEDGATVVVASHLLSEIEQICTHVGVMHRGRLVAQGSLADVRGLGRSRIRVLTPDERAARSELRRFGLQVMADDGAAAGRNGVTILRAELPDADPPPPEDVAAALVRAGVRLRGFEVQQDTLEDRFVALTGEGFDVDQ